MDTTESHTDLADLESLKEAHERILDQIHRVVVGQDETIELLLISIFARGHCILEGVPGLAKTLLVQTLSECLTLEFRRIQFTPDLMPADITGTEIIYEDKETQHREFKFVRGPIFTNLLLADEINRTPPKTQSALLEGMQERQVSTGGQRYPLPDPFFVLATQNPIEQEGTYPLPEAQLDRFLMKVLVRYPTPDEERVIYRMNTGKTVTPPRHVLNGSQILELQELVRRVPISDFLIDYTMRLVHASRKENPSAPDFVKRFVMWGIGPRGGQSLILAAKARAALAGKPEVSLEDLQHVAPPVLRHRLVLNYTAEAEGQTTDSVIARLLETVAMHESGSIEDEKIERVLKA